MSAIYLSGFGAVSPAGWGMKALPGVGADAAWPASQALERPGWTRPLMVRRVPAPATRPAWAAHARMRRAAAISQFALGAALEAVGDSTDGPLGVVFCTTCGGVNYSRRFYDEVLRDPAVASPLLFPETVFNAPASHLAAVLATGAPNYTLLGDAGVFLHGLALAAGWLADGRVGRCLVVAAEEADWITADALRHFQKSVTLAEGAGAVLLTRERTAQTWAALECVTDPEPFGYGASQPARAAARRRVAAALPAGAVAAAGAGLALPGEAFAAGAAWQVLAGIHAARTQRLPRATVLVPGAYQEAIGASFTVFPNANLSVAFQSGRFS